jgi:hypothetical protein
LSRNGNGNGEGESKGKSDGKSKRRSRFREGMTGIKARAMATATTEVLPLLQAQGQDDGIWGGVEAGTGTEGLLIGM